MMKYPLKLSVLALIAAPIAVARADLVLVGAVTIGGTGLGAVNTVLTIQSQANASTEQGCVGFTGTVDNLGNFTTASGCTTAINTDVLTGASQTQTRTLAEAGITSGSNFAILLNSAEPSGDGITVNGLIANFYNDAGTLIFSATYLGAPHTFATTATGTGNTGYEFTLTASQAATLQGLINTWGLTGIHVGLEASLSDATGGNETLFIFNNGVATVVPEPSTVVLMASGLFGLAGFARRRRRA